MKNQKILTLSCNQSFAFNQPLFIIAANYEVRRCKNYNLYTIKGFEKVPATKNTLHVESAWVVDLLLST